MQPSAIGSAFYERSWRPLLHKQCRVLERIFAEKEAQVEQDLLFENMREDEDLVDEDQLN